METKVLKRLPVGIQTYSEIVNLNCVYVDKTEYIYKMYEKQHPDEDIDLSLFTYPGPNPTTREASILMMADSVEAASRSMTDHSKEAIISLVNNIIDSQIVAGLHNESPISFRDIHLIKESFISRLRTMYHVRVAYPK